MTTLFVMWDWKYKLKTDGINEQHKKLFALLNQAHDVLASGKNVDALEPVLKGLEEYSRVHFTYEEKLMDKYKFPQIQAHRQQHQIFIRHIDNARRSVRMGEAAVKMELVRFLRDWLLDHILVEDRKYDQFFIGQRAPEAVRHADRLY